MNKTELVDLVAKSIDEPKTVVRKAIASITDAIREELGNGRSVVLFDFGTFAVIEKMARTGRNPKTGEPIEIQARKAVRFKPGKLLKETVEGAE